MIFAIALLITGSGGAAAALGAAGLIQLLRNKKRQGIDEGTLIGDADGSTPEEMGNASGEFFGEASGMATPSPDEEEKFSSLMGGTLDESDNAIGEFENESERFKFEAGQFSHAASDTTDELKKMAAEIRDLKLRLANTSQNLLKAEEFLSENKRILDIVMEELKKTSDELARAKKEYEESLKERQEKLSEEQIPDESEIAIKNEEIKQLQQDNTILSEQNAFLIAKVNEYRIKVETADAGIAVYKARIKELFFTNASLLMASENTSKDESQNIQKQDFPTPIQNMRFF